MCGSIIAGWAVRDDYTPGLHHPYCVWGEEREEVVGGGGADEINEEKTDENKQY